ncbi:MAG: hypothetical protein U5K27_04010 [Desulfotignum sp.]|nr:hypothetical protein [Desulfotignum sp.]
MVVEGDFAGRSGSSSERKMSTKSLNMSDTLFATLIEKIKNTGENPHIHVPDDWMQGRTVYGGLIAALALRSMREHAPLHPLSPAILTTGGQWVIFHFPEKAVRRSAAGSMIFFLAITSSNLI